FPAEKGLSLSVVADEVTEAATLPVPARRLPGVSQPTHTEDAANRETGGHALIAASVDSPSASLASLCPGIARPARAFRCPGLVDPARGLRRRDIKDANLQLVRLADGLRLVSALADMAASASGLNLDALSSTGQLDSMGEALDELAAQQFAEDWNGVAETL